MEFICKFWWLWLICATLAWGCVLFVCVAYVWGAKGVGSIAFLPRNKFTVSITASVIGWLSSLFLLLSVIFNIAHMR